MQIDNAMKWVSQCLGSVAMVGLVTACTPASPPLGSGNGVIVPAAPTIDEFDFNEITGNGCGMTLQRADRSPQDRQYVLFSGLPQPADGAGAPTMQMSIDGQIVAFSRTDSQGEPFITENYPLQTFTSADGSLVATVAVEPQIPADPEPGAPASGESAVVTITSGKVTVERAGQTTSVDVKGDAGC